MSVFDSLTSVLNQAKNVTLPGVVAASAFAIIAWPPSTRDEITIPSERILVYHQGAPWPRTYPVSRDDPNYSFLVEGQPACEDGLRQQLERQDKASVRDSKEAAVYNQTLLDNVHQGFLRCENAEAVLDAEDDNLVTYIKDLITEKTKERATILDKAETYRLQLSPLTGGLDQQLLDKDHELEDLKVQALRYDQVKQERLHRIQELKREDNEVTVLLADPGRLRPKQRFDDILNGLSNHIIGFTALVIAWGLLIAPVNRAAFSALYNNFFDGLWDFVRRDRVIDPEFQSIRLVSKPYRPGPSWAPFWLVVVSILTAVLCFWPQDSPSKQREGQPSKQTESELNKAFHLPVVAAAVTGQSDSGTSQQPAAPQKTTAATAKSPKVTYCSGDDCGYAKVPTFHEPIKSRRPTKPVCNGATCIPTGLANCPKHPCRVRPKDPVPLPGQPPIPHVRGGDVGPPTRPIGDGLLPSAKPGTYAIKPGTVPSLYLQCTSEVLIFMRCCAMLICAFLISIFLPKALVDIHTLWQPADDLPGDSFQKSHSEQTRAIGDKNKPNTSPFRSLLFYKSPTPKQRIEQLSKQETKRTELLLGARKLAHQAAPDLEKEKPGKEKKLTKEEENLTPEKRKELAKEEEARKAKRAKEKEKAKEDARKAKAKLKAKAKQQMAARKVCLARLAQQWSKLSQPEYAIGMQMISSSDYQSLKSDFMDESQLSAGLLIPAMLFIWAVMYSGLFAIPAWLLWLLLVVAETLLIMAAVDLRHRFETGVDNLIAGSFMNTCTKSQDTSSSDSDTIAKAIDSALSAAKVYQKTDLTIVPGDAKKTCDACCKAKNNTAPETASGSSQTSSAAPPADAKDKPGKAEKQSEPGAQS
jgi:hypothetical protein